MKARNKNLKGILRLEKRKVSIGGRGNVNGLYTKVKKISYGRTNSSFIAYNKNRLTKKIVSYVTEIELCKRITTENYKIGFASKKIHGGRWDQSSCDVK